MHDLKCIAFKNEDKAKRLKVEKTILPYKRNYINYLFLKFIILISFKKRMSLETMPLAIRPT
jgi:hypothetical protein